MPGCPPASPRGAVPSPAVLLVCHGSVVDRAAALARAAWPGAGTIDVLAYGPTPPDRSPPKGARLITVSVDGGLASKMRTAAGLLAALRRRRFDVVAVSQPSLELNRARGLLLAFPLLLGPGQAVLLAPEGEGALRPIVARAAAADLLRWLLLRIASIALVRVASIVVGYAARSAPPPPRSIPSSGAVIYLRTDIDLIVNPLQAGGSLAHTDGIVRALQREGYGVECWSTGDMALEASVTRRRLRAFLRGNVPQEVAELISGVVQAIAPPARLPNTAAVYQRYSLNNLAGLLLARRWGVPLILEANASEVKWREDWSTLRFPRLARACERLLLTRSDLVTAVSEHAAEDLRSAGADVGRLLVVPNGVDIERFAAAQPRTLPVPAGAFVIGFCGLFYPWHGVPSLVEAFVRLHKRHPDARLLLVGDGEEAPLARSLLERGGCLSAALLPGLVSRDEVPGYLAAVDVLVSPHADVHRFIGSPIKLFEYMATGKPIVASAVAQIAEMLRHRHTAMLVPPEDPEALCEALEELRERPDLRRALGSAAQREARELHSWDARVRAISGGQGARVTQSPK
ncbi:MAG TPA: glycosyltransferase family 4 protein [Solirubrobacteraceae bacterium]|jgi:glycosyltransferase involved in cell wall biosynthesis|nr:glycosyltransferase family 4 protein [Solirubrobacteraceae bacterium]